MKFISFGRPSKKIIYPLLLSVFNFCYFQCYMLVLILGKLGKHPFEILFLYSFGDILCGILELIIYCKKRNKELKEQSRDSNESKESRLSLVHPTLILPPPNETKYFYLLVTISIIVMGVLKEAGGVFVLLEQVYQKKVIIDVFQVLRIIFTSILCDFIFKIKIHRHHVVSIILIISGVLVCSFYPLFVHWDSFGISYLIFITCELVSFSLLEITEKYIMHFKYISAYKILFFEGIVTLIINIVLLIVFSFVDCKTKITQFCEDTIVNISDVLSIISNNLIDCAYIILYIISAAFLNVFRILTNKHFTPIHRSVSDILTSIFIWIFSLITFHEPSKDKMMFTYQFIGYLIVAIGILIYHEIIVIYLCKLNYYTKVEIDRRGNIEADNMQKDEHLYIEEEEEHKE